MSGKKKDRGEQVSHKIIEKRRRDRINNCLNILSQTIPAAFVKTTGKLEKAEILEMTVDYLRAISNLGQKFDNGSWLNPLLHTELQRYYSSGYSDCVQEVFRYITEVEGMHVSDTRCVRMMTYLQTKGAGITDAMTVVKKAGKTQQHSIYDKSIRSSIDQTSEFPGNLAATTNDSSFESSPVITSNCLSLPVNTLMPNASFANLNRMPSAGHCLGCSSFVKPNHSFQVLNRTSEYLPNACKTFTSDLFPYGNLYSRNLPSSMLTYGLTTPSNSSKDLHFLNSHGQIS